MVVSTLLGSVKIWLLCSNADSLVFLKGPLASLEALQAGLAWPKGREPGFTRRALARSWPFSKILRCGCGRSVYVM